MVKIVRRLLRHHPKVVGVIGLFPPFWIIGTLVLLVVTRKEVKGATALEAGFIVGAALVWPILLLTGQLEYDDGS